MGDEPNLPVLHESEEPSTVEQWREELARRDGYLSPSNATFPKEAADVGEGVEDNPSAEALGYSGARVDEIQEFEGLTFLSDGRVGPTADLGIDSENFIEDVTDWA
jgi:hypothetical protein